MYSHRLTYLRKKTDEGPLEGITVREDFRTTRDALAGHVARLMADPDVSDVSIERIAPLCRCGHPRHQAQCPAADGCWCDTFSRDGVAPPAPRTETPLEEMQRKGVA